MTQKINLTMKEREAMCHALGLRHGRYKNRVINRNRFICARRSHWYGIWYSLQTRALARRSIDMCAFEVTDSGIIALLGMSPSEAFSRKFSAKEVLMAYGIKDE